MGQEIRVFDANSAELLHTLDQSSRGANVSPQGGAISGDGARVAVACAGTGEVLLLEVDSGRELGAYEAGPMLDPILMQ